MQPGMDSVMIQAQTPKGVTKMTVIDFILGNLPMILCFIAGMVALVLEAFMPGFGVPGIAGILLETIAIGLAWFHIGPGAALIMTVIALAMMALAISMSLRSITKGRLSKSDMILKDTESASDGYRTSDDMQAFVGLSGETSTILRPTGMAIFNGVKLNVVSDGDFIPSGTPVKVIRVEGSRILVQKL